VKALKDAVEDVYVAFADIPKPAVIDACPCCCHEKNIDALLSIPLRDLSADDLASYAFSAFLTVGDKADYLYYLPRILELSSFDENWWVDPEIVGRGIRAAEPDSWPIRQRRSFVAFTHSIVEHAMKADERHILNDWLCAVARMGFPVQDHLKQIETSRQAVLALFEDNSESLPDRKLSSAFWEAPDSQHDSIVDWFYSEPIRRIPFEEYGYILAERK
jgi:hypothetical protein